MDLSKIEVVGGPLVLATASQVAKAEKELWVTFPKGYAEYMMALGEGLLGGSFVRVYPPWRVLKELAEWRARIRKHWFWDKGRQILPRERALEAVIVGDTVNGDELVFHAGMPDRLFVLPRDADRVYDAGPDLLSAVDWLCDSGKLTKRFTERKFEPFDSRKKNSPIAQPDQTKAERDDSLDATLATLQSWAKRHGLLKAAQESFNAWLVEEEQPIVGMELKEVKKDKIKISLKDQVLVFQPEKYQEPTITTTLTMTDSETGFYFGEFELHTRLDGANDRVSARLMHSHIKALAKRFFGVILH